MFRGEHAAELCCPHYIAMSDWQPLYMEGSGATQPLQIRRDHGLRHWVAVNAGGMQPSLRKAMATTVPFVKVLRGLKKL